MADIPMWNRASDVKTMALGDGCKGQWLLSHLYADELPDAVWFILGTALHTAIEEVCRGEADTAQQMIDIAQTERMMMVAQSNGIIESASKRAKRGMHTIEADIERMATKWWNDVHPTSPNRMDLYQQYQWPPTLIEHETDVELEGYGKLVTTIDAVFTGNDTAKFGEETLICDWKTGATSRSNPSQLQIYAYALRREGIMSDQATIVGQFHYLDHSKLGRVYEYWGDEQVEAALRLTRTLKDGILERKEVVYSPDWWCGYCIAQAVCPVAGKGSNTAVRDRIGEATLLELPVKE